MTATERRGAPARTRRRERRRTGSRALNAVLGLALAAGAIGVQSFGLSPSETGAPLTSVGDPGENVDAGRFAVRLESFTAARAIQTSAKTVPTEQLFLVVNVAATSATKPFHLGPPTLLTADGLRFTATDKIDSQSTLSQKWVQPGYWVSGSFFFDVPPKALPGARIVFGLPGQFVVEPYEPEVEIDLALDDAAAQKLVASAQDVHPLVKK